jgi:DEAD/DEAH box helicase domain-containing protein
VAAMDAWVLDQGTLLTVNDNAGRLFQTERQSDGTYVVVEDQQASGPRGAIGEVRVTDALLVLPRDLQLEDGAVATLASQCPSGQAAMHSFGEALRRGAQAELDIEPSEITVGLQGRRVGDVVSANLYLADTLENGAGYASELGKGDRLERVAAGIADGLAGVWSADRHLDCDTSCPDCLRSYDNRHLHPLLDWRLALDVADLCLGRDLKVGRWLPQAQVAAESFAETFRDALGDVVVEEVAGLTYIKSGGRAVLLGHPLWRIDQAGWNGQQKRSATLLAEAGLAVSVMDVRMARNFPEGIYTRLA